MTVVTPQTPVGLDSLVGQIVAGRYRILDKLGAGGMGTVFRAEQVSVRRQIALKVLDPALSFEPELIKRFHAEAEVAARLSHPNTVTLFDFGQDETGRMYIAMELAAGRSLRDVIAREAPLLPARAVHILEQIASSLADAHDHGIIHRDMKPDNVILQDRAGVSDFARVLDFGIAKLYDQTSTLAAGREPMTRAGQILGTPQYMAPEQISGTPVDGRTDIYALGIMVYEMLTARLPFTSPTVMALLAMHLHDPPRPILDWRPDLPPMLAALVMRCLEKHPAGRPPSMRALLGELSSLRASMGVPTPNPAYRTPTPGPPVQGYGTPAPGYGTPPPPPGYAPPSAPGFGTPPPPAAWPAPTPAPLSMPPPPPPPLVRPSGSGKTLGIIAAVVAAAIAAGVTVFFVTRQPDDTPSEPSTPGPTTPSEPSSPSSPPVPDKTFRSTKYGYSVVLPGSIELTENTTTGASFGQGHIEGSEVAIAVVPSTPVSDVQTLANSLIGATGAGAKLVDTRTRIIRDSDVLSVVYEVPGQGRLESCLIPGSQPFLVTIVTKPGDFDKLALFRDSLFRDRFQTH